MREKLKGACTYYTINFGPIFSQSVSLTQYVVLSVRLSVCLFQLASEVSRDIVARRRSDYSPRGAIFDLYVSLMVRNLIMVGYLSRITCNISIMMCNHSKIACKLSNMIVCNLRYDGV